MYRCIQNVWLADEFIDGLLYELNRDASAVYFLLAGRITSNDVPQVAECDRLEMARRLHLPLGAINNALKELEDSGLVAVASMEGDEMGVCTLLPFAGSPAVHVPSEPTALPSSV